MGMIPIKYYEGYKINIIRDAAKRTFLLMAVPLRRGGGDKGRAIKEKISFFNKVPTSLELEGGWG